VRLSLLRLFAAVALLPLFACNCSEEREGRTPSVRRDAAETNDAAGADAADPADADFGADSGAADLGAFDSSTFDSGILDSGERDAGGFADAEVFSDAEAFPDAEVYPDASVPDAGGAERFDVVIVVDNFCNVTTTPATIGVPMGTAFTVNWINSAASDSEVDIAKIDQFNQVPIVIGLEIGNSYHDNIREWCGNLFSGTFSFRITGCFDPHYLDVDCAL
jgi:hypothetical protein